MPERLSPHLNELTAILERDSVCLVEDVRGDYLSPHPSPQIQARPRSVEQVAAVLKYASAHGLPIIPVGGNTAPRIGPAELTPPCLLFLDGLNHLVEHAAGDLTLTAGAGMTVAKAQEIAAPSHQCIPLAPPQVQRATLGGVVARGFEGPSLHGFGAVRDQVLGLQIVHGDGRITRAGGKVVKNVSGYDLCRLYVGSRGCLGIITEVTLRLRPLAEAETNIVWNLPTLSAAIELGLQLRQQMPSLFALHAIRGLSTNALSSPAQAALVMNLRGAKTYVEAATAQIQSLDASNGQSPSSAQPYTLSGGSLFASFQDPADFSAKQGWLRFNCLPTRLHSVLDLIDQHISEQVSTVVDVCTGSIDCALTTVDAFDPVPESTLGAELIPLKTQVDRPTDPQFHMRRFQVWPSTLIARESQDLMKGVMRALDPASILNPGRFEITP